MKVYIVFCELHGQLLGFGGKCSICELNALPSFKTEQECKKCKISNFLIDEIGNILCGKCKEEFYIKKNTEDTLVTVYTTVYELYKRNYFQLPIWAQERKTKEIIFIVEVREKEDTQTNLPISDGILVARYDKNKKKLPILKSGARGKYRPVISSTGEYTEYITESHIGFIESVDMKDWKQIDSNIKPPFDLENMNSELLDEIDLFMTKFRNYNPVSRITAKQEQFLIKLGFDGDWNSLDSSNVSTEIERMKMKRRNRK